MHAPSQKRPRNGEPTRAQVAARTRCGAAGGRGGGPIGRTTQTIVCVCRSVCRFVGLSVCPVIVCRSVSLSLCLSVCCRRPLVLFVCVFFIYLLPPSSSSPSFLFSFSLPLHHSPSPFFFLFFFFSLFLVLLLFFLFVFSFVQVDIGPNHRSEGTAAETHRCRGPGT